MKKMITGIILAATIALGGVLAYSVWKSTPVTAQAFFESGKKYYDEKKYAEAVVQFLNAVQKDPRHRDGRYYMALSYMSGNDFSNAANQLNKLLEDYPDDVDANLQLGGIYLVAGRTNPDLFRQAREIADKVISKEPNNVAALILSGNASAGLQDYRSSVDFYQKAIALDPENSLAFVSLGTSQALQKNFPEAEQAFLKARAVNPKNESVLISLANYYRAVGDTTKADEAFGEVLSLYPTKREVYLQVVQFYYQVGRFDDAEKVLTEVQSKIPQDPEPSLTLINFLQARNRPEEARRLLLELKPRFPQNMDVAARLATSLLQADPARAGAEIDLILKTAPQSPVGYVLLGELQFLSGKYDEAEATLGKDPAFSSPFPQPHYLLGSLAGRKGQLDQAVDHYQKALAVNSGYLPARVALAEVFLNKGQLDDSREELRKALSVQPTFLPGRLLKASLATVQKNYAEAEAELTALAKEQPQNPIVFRQLGIYYDARGNKVLAEKNFSRALELRPDAEQGLRDLTLFYLRSKQAERAIAAIQGVPDGTKQAYHYELLGMAEFQAGRLQDSENAYKKALEKDPARTTSDLSLFNGYIQSGRVKEGLAKLDELIQKNPTNGSVYAMKGSLLEGQGNLEDAKKNYSEALKIDPNLGTAANNFAYILAEEGSDLNKALGYAQLARKQQPNNPNVADTLGWVYYKLGSYVLARDQAQFAVSKDPTNASMLYHLGMIYKANNQRPQAVEALRKAVDSAKEAKEKQLAQTALKDLSQ